MKTILFDIFTTQPAGYKFHGGGEYGKTIFKELVETYASSVKILVLIDDSRFLDEWIKDIINNYSLETIIIHERSELREVFKNFQSIEIFYSPLPQVFEKSFIPEHVKFKGTVHDLRNMEVPSDKYAYLFSEGRTSFKDFVRFLFFNATQKKRKKVYKSVLDMLDVIYVDSKHTKYSIISNFGSNFNDVKVYYAPMKYVSPQKIESSQGDYILILGGDRWVKNSARAIMALDSLFNEGFILDKKVLVVGGIPNKLMNKIINKDKFNEVKDVSSEDLEVFYANCDFFVYPSLNEGFGYPPLEAMLYGKTVVASSVTSIPEICRDSVIYVNPFSIMELKNRILQANFERVDSDVIKKRLNKVQERQKVDLKSICKDIVGDGIC